METTPDVWNECIVIIINPRGTFSLGFVSVSDNAASGGARHPTSRSFSPGDFVARYTTFSIAVPRTRALGTVRFQLPFHGGRGEEICRPLSLVRSTLTYVCIIVYGFHSGRPPLFFRLLGAPVTGCCSLPPAPAIPSTTPCAKTRERHVARARRTNRIREAIAGKQRRRL